MPSLSRSRLSRAIVEGKLTGREVEIIEQYPDIAERFNSRGGSPERYLRVAKARTREYLRAQRGEPRRHMTRYNPGIITAVQNRVGNSKMILDPMAGTLQRLSCLEKPDRGYHLVWGVELEQEWVDGYPHERLMQGDAKDLPFGDQFFDAIVVSPAYGNRDSDRTGEWWDNDDRKTYAGALGRNVSEGSGCVPYGDDYRYLHTLAWCESTRVLKAGGLFFLNIKNFIKQGAIVRVSQWHRSILRQIGLVEIDDTAVPSKGRYSGSNSRIRAEDAEKLYVFQRPSNLSSKSIMSLKEEIVNAKDQETRGGVLLRRSERGRDPS